ncbi:MAG TPA: hypothetical protein DIS59_00575, partial [Candidatus Magasanikbacteria bacterium]|nr:hypothetical protein [Candidatus Magasanikbacteria bacterium]
ELVARPDLAGTQVGGESVGVRRPDDFPRARGVHRIAAVSDVDRLTLPLAEADGLTLTVREVNTPCHDRLLLDMLESHKESLEIR